ncbi:uncharacterized protein LOC127677760 [Apodemus sylvaticus]|uniref:uncharacterized protein LOC127677760 n=1 Tax=Apodemus sylvaticus TaxID=10129 RepID=UPI002243EF57|nr:uncharacterized protein LOC127677760 [Apodemus sylvaticus]
MAEGPLPSQLPSETSDQDSDKQASKQRDPCVEQKDSVEVDEPKGPDQSAKTIAYVRPRRYEPTEPAGPTEAAQQHARRGHSQEQGAHSGSWRPRWRQRSQWTEIGGHSQAAFQEWQEPSQGLALQPYFRRSEGPHPGLGTGPVMSLYPIFTPVVPVPGRIVQWIPMFYGCWVVMRYQILATYPYTTYIPVASVTPYFVPFSAPLFFTYNPW